MGCLANWQSEIVNIEQHSEREMHARWHVKCLAHIALELPA